MSADVAARVRQLEQLCLSRGQSIGLAESCTGGLLSSWICAQPGVSRWYQGGVVSYARSVKVDVLAVPASLIAAHGEVSRPCARAMAIGARVALGSDWALSITGIAGPDGGTPLKPVGTICFGVVGPGVDITEQTLIVDGGGGREAIQRAAASFALDLLIRSF